MGLIVPCAGAFYLCSWKPQSIVRRHAHLGCSQPVRKPIPGYQTQQKFRGKAKWRRIRSTLLVEIWGDCCVLLGDSSGLEFHQQKKWPFLALEQILLKARSCSRSGTDLEQITWNLAVSLHYSACKAPVYHLNPSLPFSVNRIQNHKLKFILKHRVSSISGFNWNFYIQFPDKVISQAIIFQLNFTQRSQNLSESLNRPQAVVQVSYAIWNKVDFHSVAWGFAEDISQSISFRHMPSLFCCSLHQYKWMAINTKIILWENRHHHLPLCSVLISDRWHTVGFHSVAAHCTHHLLEKPDK